MIIGARGACLSFPIITDLGFSYTTISKVYSEWCQKREKHSVKDYSVERNALMIEINRDRFKLKDATVLHNQSVQLVS